MAASKHLLPNDPELRPGKGSTPLSLVVDALEEDIVLGRLHQRERLIEDDLLRRFPVKRHVVRQALMYLERIGLVERIPNRGSRVRAFDAETINQLYEVRELIETQAAGLIPLPLPREMLERLKAIQVRHDRAAEERDLRQAFRTNIEFHRTLFSFCSNPFLSATVDEYAYRTHAIRFYSLGDPARLARSREEHHAMIDALATGDRQALVDLCRRHLRPAKERYLQGMR